MTALPLDKALALAGGLVLLVALAWYWARITMELGWEYFRHLFREPLFLLMLLGVLLVVAAYLV